jgi:squalene synthase HpnC
MPTASFADHLKLYGPDVADPKQPDLAESRQYCRKLARTHYENFTVASFLLPPQLRQHFHNIYAYCRWADDLADETADPAKSLALLDWWEEQLGECFRGRQAHPVFVALADTVRSFDIPRNPFADLLVAFRQDQRVNRYETFEQLLDYCRHSANPVGRLVLYLGRCHDDENTHLADSICTGLQLANFWQDVARDWDRGRVYLPQEHCRRHGYDEAMFRMREANGAFRSLLAAEVAEAEEWLRRGLPLVRRVPRQLRLDVSLFVHGGLAILDEIRRQDYDVWARRPTVSKARKLRLAARCWWQLRRARPTGMTP